MMGFGGIGMGLWMVIFWVAVVALALWLLGRLFPGTRGHSGSGHVPADRVLTGGSGQALDVLNERYARGEIARAEYQQIRWDLEG